MPERPQADPVDFQQVGRKRWHFTTPHPVRYVIAPRFFDGIRHSGIASDDRIDLIALGDAPATHAILVVENISAERGVEVSVLTEYERKKLRAAA